MTVASKKIGNATDLFSITPAIVFQTRINLAANKFIVNYVNQGAVALLGLETSTFDAATFSIDDVIVLLHPDDLRALNDKFAESTRTLTQYHVHCRLVLPDIGVRWLNIVADPEAQPDGWIVWRGVIADITALKQAEEAFRRGQEDIAKRWELQRQLEHMAAHDALTGLPNRLAFERKLEEACAQAQDEGHEHVLCFMDLDRFKIVNDSAGHAAGDAFLRLVGHLVQSSTGDEDFIARLGGDEFALLFNDCSTARAEYRARELIDAIRTIRLPWEGKVYDIGASIGLTAITAKSPKPLELMSQADVACYAAKAAGRNQVLLYGGRTGAAERHHREIMVASGIRRAIEAGQLELFAQDILTLDSAKFAKPVSGARHVEILLRMRDSSGRVLRPGAFIPAAERYDLMSNLDRWVLENALIVHGGALAAIDDLSISINLSANSLNDPLFWPFLSETLRASLLPPERVSFEITETAMINNLDSARSFMSVVRAAGHALILDDFGTGLSSFNYLKQFPIDGLKIDGSFIRQLKDSPVDRVIVESINEIAHKLGIRTVAEFVENTETLDILRAMGIDQAQGYAIGRPLPLGSMLDQHVATAASLF
jgi:diguanylate cyclase (GGDEF)-like protein